MSKRLGWALGVILIAIGSFFVINSSSYLTGFTIIEQIDERTSSIFGTALLVLGIAILSYTGNVEYVERESRLKSILGEKYYTLSEREKEAYNKAYRRHSEAEERRNTAKTEDSNMNEANDMHIIRTEHFEKAIRGHDEEAIERAIRKIGSGLGKQEKLKHLSGHAIRVSRGGRIRYEYRGSNTVELLDYLPDHKYSRHR